MADYTRGDSKQIIVGAAALFVSVAEQFYPNDPTLPDFVANEHYYETLSHPANAAIVRNVGYTSNGLELQFQPNFGEVQVDQILDVAKLYKQAMQVNMVTAFAEATLENLLVAIAGYDNQLVPDAVITNPSDDPGSAGAVTSYLELISGEIGACPVERSLIAVGPGTGDCDPMLPVERIYLAYRALSIQNVNVSAKRDAPTMYEVSFRLLPEDINGSYGRIIDRTVGSLSS